MICSAVCVFYAFDLFTQICVALILKNFLDFSWFFLILFASGLQNADAPFWKFLKTNFLGSQVWAPQIEFSWFEFGATFSFKRFPQQLINLQELVRIPSSTLKWKKNKRMNLSPLQLTRATLMNIWDVYAQVA